MKLRTLKYVIPVLGTVFWIEPVHSFGFPTFDIAEVAGTVKGVVTSNMSLVSTGASTAATGQMLLEKGEGVSSLLKFKDDAVEKAKKAAKQAKRAKAAAEKAEKRKKQLEKLNKIANDTKGFVKDVKEVVDTAVVAGTAAVSTYNVINDMVEEYAPTTKDESSSNEDVYTTSSATMPTATTSGVTVTNENQNTTKPAAKAVIYDSVNNELRTFKTQEKTVAKEVVAEQQIQTVANNGINKTPNSIQKIDVTDKVLEPKQVIGTLPAVQQEVKTMNKATGSVNNNSKMAPLNTRTDRAFKAIISDKQASLVITSKTSFAQAGFASGMTDDGTFVYSDIIAEKCGMDFKDAEDEDKVKDCVKTWVLCMNQENSELALECKKQYRKAMHDQVSADLASSLNDKKYATTFEDEVAGDLENKSSATTTEREEGSLSAAISRANQEVLLRMMNSVASNLIQNSLLAVEQIEASYYDEEE